MRWAIVTQYWPVREQPYRGHSAYQTIRRLREAVDVEAFAPQAKYPNWLLPRSRPWAKTDLSFQPEVKTTYFDYPAFPVLSRYINGDVCAMKLERLIGRYRPDLILNYWVYPDGYSAVKVGKSLGIPIVTTAIGTDLNRSLSGVVRHMTEWTLRHSDLVVTVSNGLAERAIALGASNSKVKAILNGCDTDIFCPVDRALVRQQLGIEVREQSVLYVGRFDLLKGLRELVRACAQLSDSRPNLRLTLVGEGPAKEALNILAVELGFKEKLRIVPPCASRKVAEWMNAADVFALPSYAEGCPNVVVEALNCGKPIVATNVGGIPELVDHARAILVPPREVAPLAKAIDQALSTDWDYELIARRSRRSWSDTAQELYRACAEVIHREPTEMQSGVMMHASTTPR